jgi:hypothetical protein
MDVELELTTDEHDAVLTTVLTVDWISTPVWHDVFKEAQDPGLVQVVGSNDTESFAWSIGRFSNKRLEFV